MGWLSTHHVITQTVRVQQWRDCWRLCFLPGPCRGVILEKTGWQEDKPLRVVLGCYPVPGGYKYGGLALQLGGSRAITSSDRLGKKYWSWVSMGFGARTTWLAVNCQSWSNSHSFWPGWKIYASKAMKIELEGVKLKNLHWKKMVTGYGCWRHRRLGKGSPCAVVICKAWRQAIGL
jgi:hypothetical protein